jgi:hypothetical protein
LRRFSLAPCNLGNRSVGVVERFNQQPLAMRLLFVAPREQTAQGNTTETSREGNESGDDIHRLRK